MIYSDIDPSLCTSEPLLERLDDGFSPPSHDEHDTVSTEPASTSARPEFTLTTKSPF
jgi:hypothetical protein